MIYLVRHGESEWNAARRTQGQTSHPRLTNLGEQQASAAARALLTDLASNSIAEVVSSDLVRAVETAEIIAAAAGCVVRTDPRLREQSLGTFEGLGYDATFAAGAALDWSDPDLRVGGGETVREVSLRIGEVLSDLAATGRTVVAVGHGDAIRLALTEYAGGSAGDPVWLEVPNGSVCCLDGSAAVRWLPVDLPLTAR